MQTKSKPVRGVSARRAAEMRGVSVSSVQDAIERGDLDIVAEIIGPGGRVSTVGIDPVSVSRWRTRPKGRPIKSTDLS